MDRPHRVFPDPKQRERARCWKRRLLLLGLLCGLFYALEGKTHAFRLLALRTVPSGVLPEALAWEIVPGSAQRFWPLLLLHRGDIERSLGERYPVTARMRLSGWGEFSVQVTPLQPQLRLHWQDQVWLVDADGRIWKANLHQNTQVRGLRIPQGPLVYWGAGMPPPLSGAELRGDVSSSSVSVAQIQGWLQALDGLSWLGVLDALSVRREDGTTRLLASFRRGDLRVRLLLPTEDHMWPQLLAALETLWSQSPPGGGQLLVDATYKDRIIVRSEDVTGKTN